LFYKTLIKTLAPFLYDFMYINIIYTSVYPCGGGFEYLHRDPASRRRRQKGKSQIWDSKIWSRVSNDSDPRKATLVKASRIYNRQTRPRVREGAPEKQDHNSQSVTSSHEPQMGLDTRTYWMTGRQSQCDFGFDFYIFLYTCQIQQYKNNSLLLYCVQLGFIGLKNNATMCFGSHGTIIRRCNQQILYYWVASFIGLHTCLLQVSYVLIK
jgi:hypothetical protein